MNTFLRCWLLAAVGACALAASDKEMRLADLTRAEAEFFRQVENDGFGASADAFMTPDAFLANSLALGREAHAAKLKADKERGRVRTAITRSKPLRAEVSESGDLGYTWGIAESAASRGGPFKPYGVYVMIWQRQPDGKWKFVYDSVTLLSADSLEKFVREKFPAAK